MSLIESLSELVDDPLPFGAAAAGRDQVVVVKREAVRAELGKLVHRIHGGKDWPGRLPEHVSRLPADRPQTEAELVLPGWLRCHDSSYVDDDCSTTAGVSITRSPRIILVEPTSWTETGPANVSAAVPTRKVTSPGSTIRFQLPPGEGQPVGVHLEGHLADRPGRQPHPDEPDQLGHRPGHAGDRIGGVQLDDLDTVAAAGVGTVDAELDRAVDVDLRTASAVRSSYAYEV